MSSSSKIRQSRREQFEAQRRAQAKKERGLRLLLAAGGVIILGLVVAMVWVGMDSSAPKAGSEPPNLNQEKNGIFLAPYVEGLPLLEEFTSYSCSSCKSASLVLGSTLEQLATNGKANVLIHPMNTQDEDKNATIAAMCADFHGKFYQFHEQLFLEQDTKFDGTSLGATVPDTVGIWQDDLTTYKTCFDNKATSKYAQASNNYAIKEGITKTPTFRLDGVVLSSEIINPSTRSYDPDLLREVVEAKAGAANNG